MAHRFIERVMRIVPILHRSAAQWLEYIAARLARNRAHRDRRVGRTERGGAGLRDRLVQRARQDRKTVDVRKLALIGRHAQRGITLGVLDAFITFAGRELHVRDFHVVLRVQPHFRFQLHGSALRHHPHGFHSRFVTGIARRSFWRFGACGPCPRVCCIGKYVAQSQHTRGGTCGAHKRLTIVTSGRAVRIGAEKLIGFVPNQLTATMRPKVHDRRPSARHRNAFARDAFQNSAFASLQSNRHAFYALAAFDLDHGFAVFNTDPHFACFVGQSAAAVCTGVDDRGHFHA